MPPQKTRSRRMTQPANPHFLSTLILCISVYTGRAFSFHHHIGAARLGPPSVTSKPQESRHHLLVPRTTITMSNSPAATSNGHHRDGAVTGRYSPPRHHEGLAGRKEVVTGGLVSALGMVLLGGGVLPSSSVNAAVPSIEEYYGKEGARRRANTNLNSNNRPQKTGDGGDAPSASGGPAAVDPKALVAEVGKKLDEIDGLITQERWDDILAIIKSRPLSQALSPFLGYGSAAKLASALSGSEGGPSSSTQAVKSLEATRELLGVSLQQLRDYAFSNRIIFFNETDKSQVAVLAAARKEEPDLSEPRAILQDARAFLQELQAL